MVSGCRGGIMTGLAMLGLLGLTRAVVAAGEPAGPAGEPKTELPVPALPFYKVKAPPLPPPTGKVVEVKNVEELLAACAAPAEGSTILIADGTYQLTRGLWLTGLKGVTLRGKSGERTRAVLDGTKVAKGEILTLGSNCADVTIADLTVQNAAVHGITVKGEGNNQRPRIYNCRLRDCWERYVKGTAIPNPDGKDAAGLAPEVLKTRPAGGRIEFCLFEQSHPKTADDWTGGDYLAGLDLMWLKDWVISDNVFLNLQGKTRGGRGAVFVWNNSEDVLIERNLIVNCDRGICLGNPSGAAVHLTRGVVRNNFVVRGADKAIELARTRDCQVYHNTVWSAEPGYARTLHLFDGSRGARVFNNLVGGKLLVEGPDAGKVESNLSGALDGFFADPAKGDLHLTPKGAAAARGKGQPVPQGTADFDNRPRPPVPALGASEPEAAPAP